MRIAIEGMDGCGKTTVSKILVERLGYQYVDKPFNFLFEKLNINVDLCQVFRHIFCHTF